MINDTVLRMEGLKALIEKLGILEAEHFITLIKRELFNYTEWRDSLFKDIPLDVFLKNAADFRKQQLSQKPLVADKVLVTASPPF
jgi:hypothetical protein